MEQSNRGFLPVQKREMLSVNQCPATKNKKSVMANIPYSLAIGSIMYAMLSTRLDVAPALSLTSHFQSNPGIPHWTTVKCILKYLKRTKDMVLVYGGCEEEL
jgi:ATP-binding cassette subfamily B (MDR/TAP) protein 1